MKVRTLAPLALVAAIGCKGHPERKAPTYYESVACDQARWSVMRAEENLRVCQSKHGQRDIFNFCAQEQEADQEGIDEHCGSPDGEAQTKRNPMPKWRKSGA